MLHRSRNQRHYLTSVESIILTIIFVHVIGWTAYQWINMQDLPTNQKEIILDQFQYTNSRLTPQQLLSAKNLPSSDSSSTSFHEQTIQHDGIKQTNSSASSIPVFYNLFLAAENDSSRVLDIVSEQMALLRPEHKPVYIQSIGVMKLSIPNTELLGYQMNGTEMITLRSLWEYCKRNPVEKVVYLHSQGSSRNTPENEDLRKFLTIGALSKECSTLPDTCNVCSSRFSPLPQPHTSGNMWLAKCDYVRCLIDPNLFEKLMDKITSNCTSHGRENCDGRGRYSAEHWIHSHPTVKPCDLYPEPSFTWDYEGVPSNGTFDLDLAKAPRFDVLKYVKWKKCVGRGVRLEHRLDEYWELYRERPDDKSWWGWDFLQTSTNNSWLPRNKKAAKRWRNIELCWKGVVKNRNETSTKKSRAKRIEYKLEKKTPTVCPSGSRIKQGSGIDQTMNATSFLIPANSKQIKGTKKRILIISVVPRNLRHVLALWSQLECFTVGVDHVVLAAPTWSREIVTKIVELAKHSIPRFVNKEVSIQMEYFFNDRYDVGLWCDAIGSLNIHEFDEFGLINDSVFALRDFVEVYDALSVKNVSLTSLSYSYTAKNFKGKPGSQYFWVESVYRGFTREGINAFQNHSCVPADHPFFCPEKDENKDCIINNFEHDLATEFPCDKVFGLFPSDAPDIFLENNTHMTWAKNGLYWKALVNKVNFPVAKVKELGQIARLPSPRLKECTMYYTQSLIDTIDLTLAKPRNQRQWKNLDTEIQNSANELLGLNAESWGDWTTSKYAQKSFDELTLDQQEFIALVLDCSSKLWNIDYCGPIF